MSYCTSQDSFADVWINGEKLVRLESPPVDYSIEAEQPRPYSININGIITHLIQNPNNYSYSKKPSNTWYALVSLKVRSGYLYQDRYKGNYSNGFSYLKLFVSEDRGSYFPQFEQDSLVHTCDVPTNLQLRGYNNNATFENLGEYSSGGFGTRVEFSAFIDALDSNFDLVVKDGNQTYYYPILRNDVVTVVTLQGGYILTLSDTTTSITQKYKNMPVVQIVCGRDCPPRTCLKCRDGENVCCYGDNGIVLETIHDPNYLIDAC